MTSFPEPQRSRTKDWKIDSQRDAVGTYIEIPIKNRDEPNYSSGPRVKRKLQAALKEAHGAHMAMHGGVMTNKNRLKRFAQMIGDMYCIITVFGMGINGRIHGEGLKVPR